MITWMNKVNNFQIAKVQPQGVVKSVTVYNTYKSVPYKKACILKSISERLLLRKFQLLIMSGS